MCFGLFLEGGGREIDIRGGISGEVGRVKGGRRRRKKEEGRKVRMGKYWEKT